MPLETETQRQFYLGVAGIQLWYARKPQPGAAPSPDFDFGEVVGADPLALAPGPKGPQPLERLGSDEGLARVQGLMKQVEGARRSVDDKVAEKVPVDLSAIPPEVAAENEDRVLSAETPDNNPLPVGRLAEASVRSSLSANLKVWVTESFVMVCAVSSDTSVQLQENLATNILRAMGQSVKASQTFMWPVFGNPVVPGNDAEGFRQVLADFARDHTGKKFLGLGLLSDEPYEARAEWLKSAFGSLQVDYPYGLAGIATDPERKRNLWAELKPLLSRNG